MSFILDALRKAEDRNRDNHEMSVPTGPQVLMDDTPEPPPNWRKVIVLGICGLALLGAGVFFGLPEKPVPVFNSDATSKALPPDATNNGPGVSTPGRTPGALSPEPVRAAGNITQSTTPAAREFPARPRDSGARALDREAARTRQQNTVQSQPGTATATPQPATDTAPLTARTRVRNETLPEYLAVVQSGQLALPQLHLDMHVYSATPEKRLVFINLNKLKTGDKLDAQTTIESIEPDGVVIDHKGFRFILRPD
ncbi:MAG: general secretion pathway protein GspB [Gammaproteobacteria bacterium]|nr:general secretion pathway protein GspB [Gammaproteobacteria bacterium]